MDSTSTARAGRSLRMRRINVTGTSASGKTTLARALGRRLGLPVIELDALHWEANWTEAPPEVMRARVAEAIAGDAWVVDGNYGVVRDLVWSRVDTVVWLDYSLPLILGRFLRRTARRIRSREELWPGTGNRENLRQHLHPRTALLWWILRTYRRHRREYGERLAARPDIRAIRLRTPGEARRWLASLPAAPDEGSTSAARARRPAASIRCRRRSARASRSADGP